MLNHGKKITDNEEKDIVENIKLQKRLHIDSFISSISSWPMKRKDKKKKLWFCLTSSMSTIGIKSI
jgi:hypothetical protein